MRKEIIVAIIIGLFLGLVVAYGIRSAQESLKSRQQLASQTSTYTTTNPSSNSTHSLFITSPEPNSVADQGFTTIIGTTSPQSLVSVISNSDQAAVIADDSGNFTTTLQLDGGVNTIEVKSYNNQGESASTSFMVVYSTADLTATSSATNQ